MAALLKQPQGRVFARVCMSVRISNEKEGKENGTEINPPAGCGGDHGGGVCRGGPGNSKYRHE